MYSVLLRRKALLFGILLSAMALVWGYVHITASEPEGKSPVLSDEMENVEAERASHPDALASSATAVEKKPLFSNKVKELFEEFGINQGCYIMPGEQEEEDAAGQAKVKAYQHYLRGAWLFENGDYKEALEQFEQASKQNPGSSHIRYSIATCYFRLGKFEKVLEVCTDILKKTPDNVDVLILKAETFAAMDNFRKAQAFYEQVIESEPQNIRALEALGKIYFKVQGNIDKTISVYEKILTVNPKDLYSLVILASMNALKGNVEKSLAYYDRILQQQPMLLTKLIQMGQLLEEHKQYEGALKVYLRALLYDSKNVLARQNFARLAMKLKGREGLGESYLALAEEYPLDADLQELYADHLMAIGRYEEANKQFSIVEALNPENARVAVALAKIALTQDNEEQTTTALSKALERSPDKAKVYTELGLFCQEREDYARAAAYFEQANKLSPKNYLVTMHLLRAYYQLQAYDKMEALIKQSIENKHASAELYALLGGFYKDQNKMEAAIEAYQKALALEPTSLPYVSAIVDLHLQTNQLDKLQTFIERNEPHFKKNEKQFAMLIGSLYNNYGKFSESLPYLQKAQAIDPTDLELYAYLSWTYNRLHQYEQAIEVLENAKTVLGEKAQSVRYNMLLATAYSDQKRYDQAVALYEKILDDSPINIEAYRSITFCLNKQGKYKKALEYVEKAEKEIGKEKPEVVDLRGRTLVDQKQYEEAAALYKGLIDQDQTNDSYYFQLGEVYYEAKRFMEAEAAFRKAIELNENNADAYNNLGFMFAENNMNLDEAQKLIEKALELRPNAGYIIDSLGWVYFQKGDVEKAVEVLEKAAMLSGDDPVMFDHLGDAYRAKGQKDKALEYWKRALELDSSMTDVKNKIDEMKH